MNPNPYQARKKHRDNSRHDDIEKLTEALWKGVTRAQSILVTDDDILALKAVHALGTISGAFLKAIEIGEIEARLQDVEQILTTQYDKTK